MQTKATLEQTLKKMKRIIAALSVAVALCIVYIIVSADQSPTTQGVMMTNNPASQQAPGASTDQGQTGMPGGSPVGGPQSTASPNPAGSTTGTSASSTSGKLNPAHGEPGHRCDIAVGSPLNSPVVSPPANTTTSAPAATSTPADGTPAPTSTPADSVPAPTGASTGETNPPHGQPGHRCDVAVENPQK